MTAPVKENKGSRIPLPDFLRGIAVILMIQVHITELFMLPEVYESTFGRISLFLGGPPAAPLFMFIMGYFIALKKKDPGVLLQRGLKLFLGGILLNTALNFNLLYSYFSGRINYVDPFRYIFGADILPLAGLSFMVFALIHKLFKSGITVYLVLIALVFIIKPLLPDVDNPLLQYVTAFLWGTAKWSYFPLIPWIAYPAAGAAFYHFINKYKLTLNSAVKNLLMIAWFVFLIISIEYAVNIASDLYVYYKHDHFYFLWVLVFLGGISYAAWKIISAGRENSVVRYIRWIGHNVTKAYVFQWIIIGNIATELFRTVELRFFIFWFAGIVAAVSFLIYIYNRYDIKRSVSARLKISF